MSRTWQEYVLILYRNVGLVFTFPLYMYSTLALATWIMRGTIFQGNHELVSITTENWLWHDNNQSESSPSQLSLSLSA